MIMLFLHVLGAIVAFGPGFAAMVVGPMVAKEPQYANFYARSQVLAGRRLVTPVSISLAITGVAMILLRGWPALTGGKHWLEAGILLYVVAVVVAMAVQAPAGRKLVELTSQPPAPGAGPVARAPQDRRPRSHGRDGPVRAGRGDRVPHDRQALLGAARSRSADQAPGPRGLSIRAAPGRDGRLAGAGPRPPRRPPGGSPPGDADHHDVRRASRRDPVPPVLHGLPAPRRSADAGRGALRRSTTCP